MQNNTENERKHVLHQKVIQDVTMRASREGQLALIGVTGIAGLTGNKREEIIEYARQCRTVVLASTSGDWRDRFIAYPVALKYLEARESICISSKAIRDFKKWVRNEVLGMDAFLATGATMSAQLLYRALGGCEGFVWWWEDIVRRYPRLTRDIAFPGCLRSDSDFQMPFNLVHKIAIRARSFAGLMIVCALRDSGYFEASLVRKPVNTILSQYGGLVFAPHNLVKARALHTFIGGRDTYERWLDSKITSCGATWKLNVEYFSGDGIDPEAHNLAKPDVWLCPGLVKNMIMSDPNPEPGNGLFAYDYFRHGETTRSARTHLCPDQPPTDQHTSQHAR